MKKNSIKNVIASIVIGLSVLVLIGCGTYSTIVKMNKVEEEDSVSYVKAAMSDSELNATTGLIIEMSNSSTTYSPSNDLSKMKEDWYKSFSLFSEGRIFSEERFFLRDNLNKPSTSSNAGSLSNAGSSRIHSTGGAGLQMITY